MRHLGISGGGTKIVGLHTAAREIILQQWYQPDIISGISAGAILSLPIAMGKWGEIANILQHLEVKDFFNQPALNSKGKLTLRAYWNIITGKHYLGQQRALRDKLMQVINEDEYYAWCDAVGNKDAPQVVVGTVDRTTGSRHYYELNSWHYDAALDFICASAAIPIFTEGIFHNDRHLYDGGIRDHCPTAWMLSRSGWSNRITHSISIYSRPKDYQLPAKPLKPKNILAVLQDYVDISNVEVSKMDEELEQLYAAQQGIYHHIHYLPAILQSVYDTDPLRLARLATEGILAVRNNPAPWLQ